MVKLFKKLSALIRQKLWLRLFLKVGIIFAVFVIVLTLMNSMFLGSYYESRIKTNLQSVGRQLKTVNLNEKSETVEKITSLQGEFGFEIEIYNSSGRILYSTSGGQMMDYIFQNNNQLKMHHRPLDITETKTLSDGSQLMSGVDRLRKEKFFLFRQQIGDDNICEVRVRQDTVKSSAQIANRFISAVAVGVFAFALVWVFILSKKISEPITQMNKITGQMAELDFSQKLTPLSQDEIGQLAVSINRLSGELDATLLDLKEKNARLVDEIELERQLDAMRKGFVANVSHELKTPISIIQGYAEGLKLDINKKAKDQYCDVIIDESQRMNKLVLSLLSLSKYESGQAEIKREEFDIAQMARNIAERFCTKTNAKIVCKMPEKAVVIADSVQIEQCIKVYFENAVCYADKGGEITVAIEDNEGKIRLLVHNTGSYIEPEIMPQIWQSFFRGDKSHKRESDRFGLGLSIVSAIVKLHGEKCGVYNTETGVCFWFTVSKK